MTAMAAMICDFDDGASPTSGSITDTSDDSVEVKVQPVMMPVTPARRNKRKSSEPRKLKDAANAKQRHWEQNDDAELEPLASVTECRVALRHDVLAGKSVTEPRPNRKSVLYLHSRSTVGKSRTKQFAAMSDEDACSDHDDNERVTDEDRMHQCSSTPSTSSSPCDPSVVSSENTNFLLNLPFDVRHILGPSAESLLRHSSIPGRFHEDFDLEDGDDPSAKPRIPNFGSPSSPRENGSERLVLPSSSGESPEEPIDGSESCKQKQRNYKNMTRERRIEANARERTRVHTISAAFENLRRAVPSYSCHQKLSKLAILRIACSYILALANLNDLDYSSQQDCPSFSECVDLCTKTIQTEGKARKRKD